MKITYAENTTIIEYDDVEIRFIDSLDEEAKRHIRIGLATVYDYGFKG